MINKNKNIYINWQCKYLDSCITINTLYCKQQHPIHSREWVDKLVKYNFNNLSCGLIDSAFSCLLHALPKSYKLDTICTINKQP